MIQKDYPYMYARISAKRAKLFDEQEYEKLLKMGPNGISRKMEEGVYKEDIDELGARYDGVQLAELALARNLTRELSELAEMAKEEVREVMEVYLRKYDVLTFKRILRAKKTEEKALEDFLTPVGTVSYDKIKEMMDESFEEARRRIGFRDSKVDYSSYVEDAETLAEIEKGLDQAYHDELKLMAERIGDPALKRFVREESRYENIKIVLRMKKYGVERDKIESRLLDESRKGIVEEILEMNFDEALTHVISELDLDTEERLEDVEHSLEVEKLESAQRMLHTRPLSLPSILAYVVAKITEVKNLRMLLRAKETGIQNPETIRKNLILPA